MSLQGFRRIQKVSSFPFLFCITYDLKVNNEYNDPYEKYFTLLQKTLLHGKYFFLQNLSQLKFLLALEN